MPEDKVRENIKSQSGETNNLSPSEGMGDRVASRDTSLPEDELGLGAPEEPLSQDEAIETALNFLNRAYQSTNIAEILDQQTLNEIAEEVHKGYDIDKQSREDWEEAQHEAMKLAQQVRETREWAGGTVADVKYPTIATAAIQFSARAFPSIVKGREVVKSKVIGKDEGGEKSSQGKRQSRFMNYDILEKTEGWEDTLDKLLTILPIRGCIFKKIYRDTAINKNVQEMIDPFDLIINYSAKSMEEAPRITHEIELTPNSIEEHIRDGRFLRIETGESRIEPEQSGDSEKQKWSSDDKDRPHVFLEQHRWWDLDEDGYQEPYVITIHRDTKQVVKINPRFHIDDVVTDDSGEIIKIEPINYFVRYLFMHSFDGSIYGTGFGSLLLPLNETTNTLINQLLDAGSLANRQGGFIGKNIHLGKSESLRFKIGEWKPVQHTGEDLRKNVFPLPVHEPSSTLFSLLELIIQASKELSSTADVLAGETPPSNVPATTTLAIIEQAVKVLNAIYKRVHRSLKEEFRLFRKLNAMYTTEEEYIDVLDEQEAKVTDFLKAGIEVAPVSDEADMTEMQRITKAKALIEMLGQGLDDSLILKRYLEALNIPDYEKLIPEHPQKDEKVQQEWEKLDIEREKVKNERKRIDAERKQSDAVVDKILAEAESQEAKVFQIITEAYSTLVEGMQKAELGEGVEQFKERLEKLMQEQGNKAKTVESKTKEKSNA